MHGKHTQTTTRWGWAAPSLAMALLLVLAGAMLPKGAAACDAVPATYQAMKNPVGQLDARGLKYWAKQFKTKCARCHGEDGSGAGEEAKTQKVPPANLADSAFMASCSDGQLFYQINVGGEGKSAMPAFGPESDQGWSEKKLWEMVAFIRTLVR